GDVSVTDAVADRVLEFLTGIGPITLYWHRKHQALNGFYRFAIARNYVAVSPLPTVLARAAYTVCAVCICRAGTTAPVGWHRLVSQPQKHHPWGYPAGLVIAALWRRTPPQRGANAGH